MSIENQVNPSYNQPPPDFLEESTIDELSQLALPSDDKRRAILEKFKPTRDALDVVWNGLASLAGHKPAPERVKHDTRVIFAGLEKAATVYGLFVGPATVISLYQSLLKLAGVNPDNAFPNGTWQFYVEYALREDTARHAARMGWRGRPLSAPKQYACWSRPRFRQVESLGSSVLRIPRR